MKSGSGAVSDTADTYTGQTIINQGTLNITAANEISAGVTLNGGTLFSNSNFQVTSAITLGLAGGTLTYNSTAGGGGWNSATAIAFVGVGPRTLTLNGSDGSRVATLVSAIGDGGGPTSVTVSGGSDNAFFALQGTSSYSGVTTISRGVLRMNNLTAIGGGVTSAATIGNIVFTATGTNRAILETNATAGPISRSLGYGPGQIQWEGNGGFSNQGTPTQAVNLGGAGAKLTWGIGGFVPTGNILQFGEAGAVANSPQLGTIDFQNGIDLGSAVRTVDVDNVQLQHPDSRGHSEWQPVQFEWWRPHQNRPRHLGTDGQQRRWHSQRHLLHHSGRRPLRLHQRHSGLRGEYHL